MPVGRSVQFKGLETVVECYRNNDIPAFSVCYDKNVNFRYNGDSMEEGEAVLKQWLEMLKKDGSNATYTLRLYEVLPDSRQIRSNTPYDIAFNFLLFSEDEQAAKVSAAPVVHTGVPNNQVFMLLREISDLKTNNKELEMELEAANQDCDELQQELKKRPEVQEDFKQQAVKQFLPALGRIGEVIGESLANSLLGNAATGKVSGVIIDTGDKTDEQLISNAIERMKDKIPAPHTLGKMLAKIAELAENNKQQFNWYLSILMK